MDWHPDAQRVVYPDAGPYVAKLDKPSLCWHTTETKNLPTYSGSQPHFTLNPRTGDLWQHQPISKAAKGLQHLSGTVETNRANCIQVELVCYSAESVAKAQGGLAVVDLTAADYKNIASLARWIERNAGVPRKSTVAFKHYPESAGTVNGVRLSSTAWLSYSGHLGHQHVPNNDHGDPSTLDIKRILAIAPWKAVKDGKVYVRGTLRQVTSWIGSHHRKVRDAGGVNVRRNG